MQLLDCCLFVYSRTFVAWLAERCNFIAMSGYSIVILLSAVCDIDALWKKTTGSRITQFSLLSVSTISISSLQNEIGRESPWTGALIRMGWFSTSRCYISEMVRDTA